MNIALWTVQVILALLALSGGAYKIFAFDALAKEAWFGALSRGGWTAAGMFEMLCAALLVLPAATRWMPVITPVAAAALALESLALAGLYGRYSLAMTAANPLVWAAAIGLTALFVAYGRHAPTPHG